MTKKKYGIRTVNNIEPDPITGDVSITTNGQNLQSTLEAGNYATNRDLQLYSSIGNAYTHLSYNAQIEVGSFSNGRNYSGNLYPNGLYLQEYGDFGFYRVSLQAPINKLSGTNSVSYYFPEKTKGNYTLVTTSDLPLSSSYGSSINDRSSNVNNTVSTYIQQIYYTKIGNIVSCSASVSIETNKDTSAEIAFIQISLPFPKSSLFTRLNSGSGALHGGGLGNLFVPAIVQLEGTNNVKIIFSGKTGDNGSSYQGEVHWTYETD